MADSIRRVQAFNEKVGPTAAWDRVGAESARQSYGVSAGKSFQLERGVKAALASYPGSVPRVSGPAYLAFARKAGKTIGQYGAGTIAVELLTLEDLVAARGLSRTVWRFVLLRVFGYGSPVPPFVEVEDVNTGSYAGDGTADRLIATGLTGTLRCVHVVRVGVNALEVVKHNTMAGKLAVSSGADRNFVAFVGNDFTVDSDVSNFVNGIGFTYHWAAWASTP